MNRLPLFSLFGATAISLVGYVLTTLAIPWFVLATTGSAARTGIVAAFSVLPVILATFFGGTLIDRIGNKRASVIADVLSGVTVALIPLLHSTVGLPFWGLLVLVFLGALLDAPGSTARTAMLPDLAEPAGMRLERAGAIIQAIERGAHLLGAPLAGLLIVVLGPSEVLWVDAVTFFVSAAVVAWAVPGVPKRAEGASPGYWSELASGLRFIREDRLILTVVLTVMLTNLLDAPLFSVLMPVYAREVLGGAADLGLAFAAFGGGSVAGAVVYAIAGHRLSRRVTFIGAFILVGLPFWILSTLPSLPVVTAALALLGVAAGPINPLLRVLSYERVPKELRGRVLGTLTAAAYVAIPLGMLAGGVLVEYIGLRLTLLSTAACYLLVTVSLLFNPVLRQMDAPQPTLLTAELAESAETV